MIESVVRYFVYYVDSNGIRCYQSFDNFEDVLSFLSDEYQKLTGTFGAQFIQITVDSHLENGFYYS